MLVDRDDYNQGGSKRQRVNSIGCSRFCTLVSMKATRMTVVDVCLYLDSSSYDVPGLSSLSAK